MRNLQRFSLLLGFALLAATALAQTIPPYVQLIDSVPIQDAAGNAIASGNITFTPYADAQGTPVYPNLTGGGAIMPRPVKFNLLAGTLVPIIGTAQLVDITQSNPENFCYRATIHDNQSGQTWTPWTCLQPAWNATQWCSSPVRITPTTVCDLAKYIAPNQPATAQTYLTGVNWRGAWSSLVSYSTDDAVSYNGASYVSTSANNLNNAPPATGWALLAAEGASAITGMSGDGAGDATLTGNFTVGGAVAARAMNGVYSANQYGDCVMLSPTYDDSCLTSSLESIPNHGSITILAPANPTGDVLANNPIPILPSSLVPTGSPTEVNLRCDGSNTHIVKTTQSAGSYTYVNATSGSPVSSVTMSNAAYESITVPVIFQGQTGVVQATVDLVNNQTTTAVHAGYTGTIVTGMAMIGTGIQGQNPLFYAHGQYTNISSQVDPNAIALNAESGSSVTGDTFTIEPGVIYGAGLGLVLSNTPTSTLTTDTLTIGGSHTITAATTIGASGVAVVTPNTSVSGVTTGMTVTGAAIPSASTTGTWTSGTNQISVASATNVQIGMLVTCTNVQAATTVTAIAGTLISLSQYTSGSGSGTSCAFNTWLTAIPTLNVVISTATTGVLNNNVTFAGTITTNCTAASSSTSLMCSPIYGITAGQGATGTNLVAPITVNGNLTSASYVAQLTSSSGVGQNMAISDSGAILPALTTVAHTATSYEGSTQIAVLDASGIAPLTWPWLQFADMNDPLIATVATVTGSPITSFTLSANATASATVPAVIKNGTTWITASITTTASSNSVTVTGASGTIAVGMAVFAAGVPQTGCTVPPYGNYGATCNMEQVQEDHVVGNIVWLQTSLENGFAPGTGSTQQAAVTVFNPVRFNTENCDISNDYAGNGGANTSDLERFLNVDFNDDHLRIEGAQQNSHTQAVYYLRSSRGSLTNSWIGKWDGLVAGGGNVLPWTVSEASSHITIGPNDTFYKITESTFTNWANNSKAIGLTYQGCGDDCISVHGHHEHAILIGAGTTMTGAGTSWRAGNACVVVSNGGSSETGATSFDVVVDGLKCNNYGNYGIEVDGTPSQEWDSVSIKNVEIRYPVFAFGANQAGLDVFYGSNFSEENVTIEGANTGQECVLAIGLTHFDFRDSTCIQTLPNQSNTIGFYFDAGTGGAAALTDGVVTNNHVIGMNTGFVFAASTVGAINSVTAVGNTASGANANSAFSFSGNATAIVHCLNVQEQNCDNGGGSFYVGSGTQNTPLALYGDATSGLQMLLGSLAITSQSAIGTRYSSGAPYFNYNAQTTAQADLWIQGNPIFPSWIFLHGSGASGPKWYYVPAGSACTGNAPCALASFAPSAFWGLDVGGGGNLTNTGGYIGSSLEIAQLATPTGAPTGTASPVGGGLTPSTTYYIRIAALDINGGVTLPGTEASQTTSGSCTGTNTCSLAWTWTPVPGANQYQIWVSTSSGAENSFFAGTAVNTYLQTAASGTGGTIPAANTTGAIAGATWAGGIIGAAYGGTGANERTATGIQQWASGTSSVSTALANGTTATTPAAGSNNGSVSTTQYVDRIPKSLSCFFPSASAANYCQWNVPSAITVMGVDVDASNTGTSCSTYPIWELYQGGDLTATQITATSGTASYHLTGLSQAVAASPVLIAKTSTAGSGCTGSFTNVNYTVWYR